MKKRHMNIYLLVALLLIGLSACSHSRKNELIYQFTPKEEAISIDSLKSEILGASGAEMLVFYPDSDVVIIHYDRFKTHQNIIESHFMNAGYSIKLLEKSRIEEKDQPWQKK